MDGRSWAQVLKQPKEPKPTISATVEEADAPVVTQESIATKGFPADAFEATHHFVRQVLNEWDSYQLAVKDSLGGMQTAEKDKWLGEVLTEHLLGEKAGNVDELADWLDDILDEDFNLVLEDGSLETTAQKLLHFMAQQKAYT